MARDPFILYLKKPSKRRFAELVEAHRELLLNAAWRATGDIHVAEDVAHDVLLKLHHSKLEPGGVRSPRGLLVTMTVNAARSRLRGESRRRDREREAVRRREEAAMDSRELVEVRAAVSDLPEELRECVELRYFGGLPLAAVAKATGLALRTVNKKLGQARDRMRERLAGAAPRGLLAFLAGDQEEGLPGLEPSYEFLKRTDRLVAELSRPEARPTRTGPVVAGGAGVCAVLVISFLLLFKESGEEGPGPAPEEVAGLVDSGTVEGLADPRPAVPEDGTGPAAPAEGDPAGAAADRPGGEGAATGFSIRVEDEEGGLLREGELIVALSGLPDLDQLAKLEPWKGLLRSWPLARTNPFEVTNLPPVADELDLRIRAKAPGRPPSPKLEITVQAGRVQSMTLVVPQPREIPVRVLSRYSGEPVAGAAVVSITELRRRGLDRAEVLGKTGPGAAVTGPDGTCRLKGLGVEPHDVEVHAPGHDALTLYELELEKEALFKLEPVGDPGTVVVRVTGPEGRGVPGLRVNLNAGGASTDVVRRTDEQGTCRFESVVPGGAVVNVETDDWFGRSRAERWADDEGVLSRRIKVTAGGETEVRLGLVPATSSLRVEVRDPEGAPVEGVEVTLSGNGMAWRDTDATGTVLFEKLPAAKYVLQLGPWHSRRELDLGDEEERVVTLVQGQATVSGRTEPGANVALRGPGYESPDPDEEGRFEVGEIPPGTWVLQAWTKDRLSLPVTVEVVGSESPEPVTLELIPCGRILVTFRAPDRQALSEAEIRLLDDRGKQTFLNVDKTGEFDLKTPILLPGRYALEVTLPGREPRRTTVEVTGGEDTTVELGAL